MCNGFAPWFSFAIFIDIRAIILSIAFCGGDEKGESGIGDSVTSTLLHKAASMELLPSPSSDGLGVAVDGVVAIVWWSN